VSSSAAYRPNPGQGFYAASKLASEALYRNLGLELGEHGVTAVILRPGYIDAGRGKKYMQGKGGDILRMVPIKRVLNTAEVAETILFLLSDSAAGFNATEISLDGGLTAGK
jgi:3-oxoacyl-[acyl-carrier protein] reductase